MCFSAPASFVASAGIAVIGIATIRQAKTRPQYILAGIPIIFSIQQLAEGFLWLRLSNAGYEYLQNIPMYLFLVVAQVIWPTYVPYAILAYEKDAKRKKIIGILLGLGLLTSGYFLYCLLFYPVQASIGNHHIVYDLHFPLSNKWYSGATYMLATVLASLLSGMKRLRYFGLLLLVSYLIASFLYKEYLISVWCYFSAVLSVYTLYIVRKDNQSRQHNQQ